MAQPNYFMIALLCVIVYMAIYALLDRICRCFEYCARARYCAEYMSKSEMNEEIDKKIQK